MSEGLRRYTNLAALLHILHNRCITLLSPETWDDRNDAFFMSEYQRQKNLATVLAICFAQSEETYHHWQVFSRGMDGVCIEFDVDKLLPSLDKEAGVRHGSINYEFLREANKMTAVDIERLPFMKRWPYAPEREYRAIYTSSTEALYAKDVPVGLNAIKRVTLSPWLPKALEPAVKKTIKAIDGCKGLKVYQSTLVDNEQWKKLTGRVAPPTVPPR